MRLRSTSRCDGLGEELDADLAPANRGPAPARRSPRTISPAVSTTISAGRPSGSSRMPVAVALGEADLVEQRVRLLQVELRPCLAVFGLVERALRQHGVLALEREAEEHHLVDLVPVDGERQGAAEAHVAEQLAPHRIVDVQVGIERHWSPLRLAPQPHLVARCASPPASGTCSCRSADSAPAGRIRPRRSSAARSCCRRRHHHPVDVGKLMARRGRRGR